MSSDIALNIATSYSDSGIKKAADDVRGFGQQVDQSAARSSTSYEGLFKKLEKPLSRNLFQTLATQTLSAGSSMDQLGSRGAALTGVFHTVGIAAMTLGGTIGTVGLVAGGLIAIFSKLHKSAEDERKGIEDHDKAIRSEIDTIERRALSLKKSGEISEEQYKRFLRIAEAKKKDLQVTQEQISVEGKRDQAASNFLDKTRVIVEMMPDGTQKVRQYNTSLLELTVSEQKLIGIGADYEEMNRRKTESDKKRAEALRELAKVSKEASEAMWQASHAANVKMEQDAQKFASVFMQYADAIGGAFEKRNGLIIFSAEQFAKEMIQITAKQISQQLAFWGAMDILTGNIAKGAAELAGSAAIAAAGGIVGTWGEGQWDQGGNRGGHRGRDEMSSGSTVTQANSTQLTVIVQGGIMDDQFAANLAKRLSEVVGQNNVQLTATKVMG